VTFYGRGYGHGLGLSRYGARGRALAGQLAPDILAHYYEHTTLAAQSTATPIRVLVVEGYTPTTAEWTDLGSGVWSVGPATATELFFHDVPKTLAAWATERLRPQWYGILDEVAPTTPWPEVECRSIVCRDDRAINPAWVRTAARERLGTEAIEIDGGHSPFLTRPAELAALLDPIV
jgi:pimeloyl-ACP methyl ester carboxylesterase